MLIDPLKVKREVYAGVPCSPYYVAHSLGLGLSLAKSYPMSQKYKLKGEYPKTK